MDLVELIHIFGLANIHTSIMQNPDYFQYRLWTDPEFPKGGNPTGWVNDIRCGCFLIKTCAKKKIWVPLRGALPPGSANGDTVQGHSNLQSTPITFF